MNTAQAPGAATGSQSCSDGTSESAVSVRGARFRWPGSVNPTLDIDALDIRRGERVFLAGPSGSGKSTLLALLGGVVRPQAGSVRVLDTDLARLAGARVDRFRADHVGFVFQMFNLVPYLSTLENVLLPCRFSRARAARVKARTGSASAEAVRLLEALELGGAEIHRRNVTGLSIGQQQRVAAARALIGAPELIIADEPTSALDEGTRERFLQLLFAECAACGSTLLLVSHDARLGGLFDRKLALADINAAPG